MNGINPDYEMVGEECTYSLDTLTKATNLVLGAGHIGANSDVSGPMENGIAPACRALTVSIEMAAETKAYSYSKSRLSQNLCKPPMWCRIGARQWR